MHGKGASKYSGATVELFIAKKPVKPPSIVIGSGVSSRGAVSPVETIYIRINTGSSHSRAWTVSGP